MLTTFSWYFAVVAARSWDVPFNSPASLSPLGMGGLSVLLSTPPTAHRTASRDFLEDTASEFDKTFLHVNFYP